MAVNRRTLNARHQELQASQAENADLTYTINYAPELDTDTIASSSWSTEDSGVTLSAQANTTTQASCKVTGDIGRYLIVNKIVTAAGDTHERYINLRIKDNSKYYWPDFGYSVGYR